MWKLRTGHSLFLLLKCKIRLEALSIADVITSFTRLLLKLCQNMSVFTLEFGSIYDDLVNWFGVNKHTDCWVNDV